LLEETRKDSLELEKLKVCELKKAINSPEINQPTKEITNSYSSKYYQPNQTEYTNFKSDIFSSNEQALTINQGASLNVKLSPKPSINRGSSIRASKQIHFESEQKIESNAIPFLILIKDTRIASMLFVVSLVFVATYLLSILATRSILPNDNLYIIYLYFTNSAANPFINLFINRSFRYDLFRLLKKSKPSFTNVFNK
jgi:hypothetical protein